MSGQMKRQLKKEAIVVVLMFMIVNIWAVFGGAKEYFVVLNVSMIGALLISFIYELLGGIKLLPTWWLSLTGSGLKAQRIARRSGEKIALITTKKFFVMRFAEVGFCDEKGNLQMANTTRGWLPHNWDVVAYFTPFPDGKVTIEKTRNS